MALRIFFFIARASVCREALRTYSAVRLLVREDLAAAARRSGDMDSMSSFLSPPRLFRPGSELVPAVRNQRHECHNLWPTS